MGWKVANVPLVADIDPPEELFSLDPRRVAGLIIDPQRLMELRASRLRNMGQFSRGTYTDYENIQQEIRQAKRFFRKQRWALIDVTGKAVEETANEVLVKLKLK